MEVNGRKTEELAEEGRAEEGGGRERGRVRRVRREYMVAGG